MHIGIITSGNENIRLFNILNKFNIKYTIWYDSLFRNYGDKPFDISISRIEKGIEYLKTKNVDNIIISPVYELYFQSQNIHQNKVLPIFSNYLQKFVFKYSKVGKIGIAGNHCDLQIAEQIIQKFSELFHLTETQKNITKKSKSDVFFKFWSKETTMRDYFLNIHSPRQNMINKYLKLDCRYFKDADIDTIVPMQYSYFMFEKGFQSTFFGHKTIFHGKQKLSEIIDDLFKNFKKQTDSDEVEIYFTGSDHLFFVQKKRQRLICNGKTKKLKILKI